MLYSQTGVVLRRKKNDFTAKKLKEKLTNCLMCLPSVNTNNFYF